MPCSTVQLKHVSLRNMESPSTVFSKSCNPFLSKLTSLMEYFQLKPVATPCTQSRYSDLPQENFIKTLLSNENSKPNKNFAPAPAV